MKLNKAAATVFAGTFIGVAGYSATVPAQVQAKASYRVQITKNASVYTSKGKKTKTVYKKNKVLTAYKIRKIKGKYYYDLGKGKYVRTSYAKKYYYRTTTQSKKLVRTIKLYQPKGTKVVKQNAYVKRTVKQNLKTKKKTYGKWGSASWKAYKAPAVSGYTASPKQVAKETVYSWSKNKTVKVKYKKKAAKKANSSSEHPSSPDTTAPKVNPWTPEKTAAVKQSVLKVINDFRSQVGRPPVMLNSDYDELLKKRALEKTNLWLKTESMNHDGFDAVQEAVDKQSDNKFYAAETLDTALVYGHDSDDKQITAVVAKYKSDMQMEKDDYEAIYINHTRKKITNYAGTIGHYASIINWNCVDADTNQVAIDVECQNVGGGENIGSLYIACLVIEFLYPKSI